ncbi:hypothetical protein PF005_g23166 [Phytophthora fragariae]|uniref:Uncharacterized protein n=1 Tax=Phytophthora fragariae TaxID=53985 RepID=A0A6A3W7Y4_9STRA|nr:hypothetical protein PF006_g21217 [Phytophthora fragariae]KAE9180725.1 hypothetical protein PF005_g23166 [Phytophthora fragariae]
MEGETKEKDGGRAMRYVATVRPAMAAARYVRADSVAGQRGQEGGIAHEENEVEIRSAAGEQQLDKSDRPSGEKAPAGGAIESEEGERPTERSATDETAQCDTRTEDSPELVKEGATEQELQSDEARRRRAKNSSEKTKPHSKRTGSTKLTPQLSSYNSVGSSVKELHQVTRSANGRRSVWCSGSRMMSQYS